MLASSISSGVLGQVIDYGIVRRARAAGLVEINSYDLRQWSTDKHHIDDRPFGVADDMKPEPIFAGVEALTGRAKGRTSRKDTSSSASPQGQGFPSLAQDSARTLLKSCLCGRYEGVDERVSSAGHRGDFDRDYVLSGANQLQWLSWTQLFACCPAHWAAKPPR